MAEKVASIYAEITANTTGLQKGLEQTKTGLKATAKEFTSFGGSAKDTIKQLAGMAIAGGIAYKAFDAVGDFFRSSVYDTIDYAKAVRDVSRYTGMAADQSSIMLQIADDLQIETQTLKVGFRNLAKEGIQPSIDNLKKLATEYQSITDPVQKAQFAMEKFGARSGMELAKILELTSGEIDNIAQSATNLGLVLDEQAIAKTEEYRLAVDELSDAWKGLKTTVGMQVIPALGDLAQQTANNIDEQAMWDRVMKLGIYTQDELYAKIRSGTDIYQVYSDTIAILNERGGSQTEAAFARGQMAIKQAADAAEEAGPAFGTLGEYIEGVVGAMNGVVNAAGLIDMGFEALNKSAADQQRMQTALALASGDLTKAEMEQLIAQQETLDNFQQLVPFLESGAVGFYDYADAVKDGALSEQDLNSLLGTTREKLSDIVPGADNAASAITKIGPSGADAAMAVDAAAGQMSGALGSIAGAAGAAASAIDGIGASINALPKVTTIDIIIRTHKTGDTYQFEQMGGPVQAHKPYIVGEAGPELFVPNTSGEIIPNHKLASMSSQGGGGMGKMGGDTIIINNNSAGAAALTMALISQSHRGRLSRSMGG